MLKSAAVYVIIFVALAYYFVSIFIVSNDDRWGNSYISYLWSRLWFILYILYHRVRESYAMQQQDTQYTCIKCFRRLWLTFNARDYTESADSYHVDIHRRSSRSPANNVYTDAAWQQSPPPLLQRRRFSTFSISRPTALRAVRKQGIYLPMTTVRTMQRCIIYPNSSASPSPSP